ncbi:MAG: hypothetical protein ACXWBP_08215 [Limisphaerales bacterium]
MTNNAALIVPPPSATTNVVGAQVSYHDTAKPLIVISNGWLWVWCALGAIALVAIAYFIWKYYRTKAAMPPLVPVIPAHVRARRALEKALSLISEPKPFTTVVSDTLRTYLEERFTFRAPERTTEEFLYELQSSNLLTSDQKVSLAEFLSQCDLVKFAKYEPTETELRSLHGAAMRLVNETEPREIIDSGAAGPQPVEATTTNKAA